LFELVRDVGLVVEVTGAVVSGAGVGDCCLAGS